MACSSGCTASVGQFGLGGLYRWSGQQGGARLWLPGCERSSTGGFAVTASVGGASVFDADDFRHWAFTAAAAAEARKGVDTTVIDVGNVLLVTELFVITHGGNARQVRSITDGVEESVKSAGGPPLLRSEGVGERQWVLLDYGAFVVHVFDAERRSLYQLERLWADCPRLDWRAAEQ